MNGKYVQPAAVASVQIWGKGFRVTEDSEEFQRLVPKSISSMARLERCIAGRNWGANLGALYRLSDQEVGAQRCVLLDGDAILGLSLARSADRHGRQSIVVATATVNVNWDATDLGLTVGKIVALAGRLALAYAEVFRGCPPLVAGQLREGTFLASREFELADEGIDEVTDWPAIMAAVRNWRGIAGVATAKLLGLGANVALGTRHESERAQLHTRVDGYFDVREKSIVPLTAELQPWGAAFDASVNDHPGPLVDVASPQVEQSLKRIAVALERLVEVGQAIARTMARNGRI